MLCLKTEQLVNSINLLKILKAFSFFVLDLAEVTLCSKYNRLNRLHFQQTFFFLLLA